MPTSIRSNPQCAVLHCRVIENFKFAELYFQRGFRNTDTVHSNICGIFVYVSRALTMLLQIV